jgi:Tfp pilus assembly protein PilX
VVQVSERRENLKAPKAVKKLAKLEVVLTDILERYATDMSEVRDQLEAATAALRRARSAIQSENQSGSQAAKKSSNQSARGKTAAPKRLAKKASTPTRASVQKNKS